jgi:hypothetical protein
MNITWDDLKIKFDHIENSKLIEDWEWLIGDDKQPILITSIGDLFLADNEENCYWLNVGEGVLTKVATNLNEFNEHLNNDDLIDEWFLVGLVKIIKESGLTLTPNHLYGYKKLPIIGGEYALGNFELTDIEVHFSIAGQIHEKITDLPNGTEVDVSITE